MRTESILDANEKHKIKKKDKMPDSCGAQSGKQSGIPLLPLLRNGNSGGGTNLFTKKETCYYKMIDKFFKDCTDDQITKMLEIINKESEISLRILDWFVTRYAKKKNRF